jgi:hypothetical protein
MSPQRLIQSAALGLALAAVAAPAAVGAQDLRSPDAREGAPVVRAGHDLRSPDARSTHAPRSVSIGADLRSPDSRDAAEGRGTSTAPDVMVVELREPAPAPARAADGMDWGDAGLGAAGLLGLVALALGGVFAAGRRRHSATLA